MSLRTLLDFIKVEHTLFSMPFLYSGAILAANGLPSAWVLVWITLGLFSARTAAMSLNRLIDRDIDALNPRTQNRPLVRGEISPGAVKAIIAFSLLLLLLCAAMLNRFCVLLYPLAVGIIWLYPYTKRFTWASHLMLGSALAIAPAGAWAAVTASLSLPPLLLALAVVFWVAGFDVIYAMQDLSFDREQNLYSIPAIFGRERALKISTLFHLLMALLLLALYFLTPLGTIYLGGVIIIFLLLLYEHHIVRPENLGRVGVAFFKVNAAVSLILFLSMAVDIFL